MRICLDSNCLRNTDLIENALHDIEEQGFLSFPDVLLVEIIKSSDWPTTLTYSLSLLKNHPDKIEVLDSIGAILNHEQTTGESCANLLNEDLSQRFRLFLCSFQDNPCSSIELISEAVQSTKPDITSRLQTALPQHVSNLDLLNHWRDLLPDDIKKELRTGNEDGLGDKNISIIAEILTNDVFKDICERALIFAGYPSQNAKALSRVKSISFVNFIAYQAFILRWFALGGLHSRKDQQIENDYIDLEVVVTGLYCHKNISQDQGVQELDKILRPLFS